MNPDKIMLDDFAASDQRTPLLITSNSFSIALGMALVEVQQELGRVMLHCEPQAIFVQGAGVLQGGALSAIADFAMAFAVLAALPAGSTAATTTLNVSFLRAAPPGRYVAIGQVERLSRNVAFTHARLLSFGDDKPVVTATSSMLIRTER